MTECVAEATEEVGVRFNSDKVILICACVFENHPLSVP